MNPPDALIDDLQLLDPPEPFRVDGWLWAGMAAAVLLLAALFLHVRRRARLRALANPGRTEGRRSGRDALADLDKLRPLVERGESLAYAEQSSEIIRTYAEERFGFSAPRWTTEEFLQAAGGSSGLEPRLRQSLQQYLQQCDQLKFARATAGPGELRLLHQAAVEFIRQTRTAAAGDAPASGTAPSTEQEAPA